MPQDRERKIDATTRRGALIATLCAVPVAVATAIGLATVGYIHTGDRPAAAATSAASSANPLNLPPVEVSRVPRTTQADRYCPKFLAALPRKLDGLGRRRVEASQSYFAAWGSPPVIIQCGVAAPAKFTVASKTTDITPPGRPTVRWFWTGTAWVSVDRPAYVSVLVPDGGDATGILYAVNQAFYKSLPAVPIRPHDITTLPSEPN